MIYGLEVALSYLRQPRSVIGAVSRSGAGNVYLRVGRENENALGWHQTEHVVLTPVEARALALELVRESCEDGQVALVEFLALARHDIGGEPFQEAVRVSVENIR